MKKYIIRENSFKHDLHKSKTGGDANIYDDKNYTFVYKTSGGGIISAEDMSPNLKRHIKLLKIPPAYNNVKINLNGDQDVLAIGIDSKGRPQYIYNKTFTDKNEDKKYFNLIEFGRQYKKIMTRINADLTGQNCIDKEIATVLKIISECNFRIGNDLYKENYNSYGVSTLESKHVKINGENIDISFIGKKGVHNKCSIKHRKLSRNLRHKKNLSKSKSKSNKGLFNISNQQINSYLKDFGDFSSKNFRTWNANIEYIFNIQEFDEEYRSDCDMSIHGRKIISNKAAQKVAEQLHHTAAVCKKNYIDRHLIDLYINDGDQFYKSFKIKGNRNKNLIIEEFIQYLKRSFS
jgi:DNA topoisomerase-1